MDGVCLCEFERGFLALDHPFCGCLDGGMGCELLPV